MILIANNFRKIASTSIQRLTFKTVARQVGERLLANDTSPVIDRQSSGNVGGSNLPRFLWLMRVV
jgi:hypothetical protein